MTELRKIDVHGITARAHSIRCPQKATPEILTGSGAILRSLEKLGITDVFGLPGGAIMPFYDELMSSRCDSPHPGAPRAGCRARGGRLCLVDRQGRRRDRYLRPRRHQPGDGHCGCPHGLGAADRHHRQVFSTSMGTDAFQEVDIVGITMPITKHSFLVTKPEDVPKTIAAAYQIATTGRPGPVLIDVTKDCQQNSAPFIWPPKVDLPGYRPVVKAHGKQINAAAKLLVESKRPVLYVGGGVIRAGASAELLEAGRSRRCSRGHHPDGPRRIPRLAQAAPRHAGHARHGSGGARRCRNPTC
jgi:acetolactate synthase-1/2/3 large subunit